MKKTDKPQCSSRLFKQVFTFFLGILLGSSGALPTAQAGKTLDACVWYLSATFIGRPPVLWGINTPGLQWWPHSLRQVLGVGGGPRTGSQVWADLTGLGRYPQGEVTVSATDRFVSLELDMSSGSRSLTITEDFFNTLQKYNANGNPRLGDSPTSYRLSLPSWQSGPSYRELAPNMIIGELGAQFSVSLAKAPEETDEAFRERVHEIVRAFFQLLRR